MTTLNANGRAERKSLANQIDRLDRILDGLADGLNEAVVAVREGGGHEGGEQGGGGRGEGGARQRRAAEAAAAQAGQPAERARLGGRMLCQGVVRVVRGCWNGAVALARCCREKAMEGVALVQEGGDNLAHRVRRGMTSFARRVWLGGMVVVAVASRFRKPLVIALAVGTMVGLGCYLGGPSVASLVSGVGGFLASLVASALNRLRRLLLVRDRAAGVALPADRVGVVLVQMVSAEGMTGVSRPHTPSLSFFTLRTRQFLSPNTLITVCAAAEGSIIFDHTPNTQHAAFFGTKLGAGDPSKAAIDANFTDMGNTLAFDRSGLDLAGLGLILQDMVALQVSNGKLTGTKP